MTDRRRVLVIGLDGYDFKLAQRFMEMGHLPNLGRLRDGSASFELDHGRDRFSGLSWEHVSSGRSPTDGGRWSAITFDRDTYSILQEPTFVAPFLSELRARTVIFDLPYCDIALATRVRGLTSWGAHDPGVAAKSRPEGLHEELRRRFGDYPAEQWIYGFSWPSPLKTQESARALRRATDLRANAARWLLIERLPDWDLGVVVVSECHSAAEPLWHGVDPSHPLHGLESGPAAAQGLLEVYVAIDRLIGTLSEACPEATLMVFAMHGMGPNEADIGAMVLLPELLYRHAFGTPYMRPLDWPGYLADGTPLLDPDSVWEAVMLGAVPCLPEHGTNPLGVVWMPATRYSHHWPRMPAFALPSYYDGRIRVNVQGREARGIIEPKDYAQTCEDLVELLHACTNVQTGASVVAEVDWPKRDPHNVGPTEADLYVVWKSAPLGLATPGLGPIGPVPFRRTGGHTGSRGFLYVAGNGIQAGHHGLHSSFDVVPTIIEMLGEVPSPNISGRSLVGGIMAAARHAAQG